MYWQNIGHKFPADLLMKTHLSNTSYNKLDFRDCKVCKFDPSKLTEPCEIYRFSMRNFILSLWNVDFLQICISKAICLMICKEILQRSVNVLNVDWLKFCSHSNSAVLALFGSLKNWTLKQAWLFYKFFTPWSALSSFMYITFY